MTNADIKSFAKELAQILSDIDDKRLEAKSLLEAAKDAGVNTKALAKLAKEMNTDSDKLAQQYEVEEQLSLFRDEVGIRRLKGLHEFAKVDA